MKKIINNKDQIVDDMLSGYIKANRDRVIFSNNSKRIILRSHTKNIEKTAMLIGNGFSSKSNRCTQYVVRKSMRLKVIDADALKALSFKDPQNSLLTPHFKELEQIMAL